MKAKAFKLVSAALLLVLIGSGAAFADGPKRHYPLGNSGYCRLKGADYYRAGGPYDHRLHYYPRPYYYHYSHGGPLVRSYYYSNYYGPGYGNFRPEYGGNNSYISGSYFAPGFGFSFGVIGR